MKGNLESKYDDSLFSLEAELGDESDPRWEWRMKFLGFLLPEVSDDAAPEAGIRNAYLLLAFTPLRA